MNPGFNDVQIFDSFGLMVRKLNKPSMSDEIFVGDLPDGLYFVKSITEFGIDTRKIIILH